MKILYGKSADSIEEVLFNQIKKTIKEYKKAFVIVPSQAMFLMEKQIIERCGVNGFFSLEVVSFERLTDKIFSKTGGRAVDVINSSGTAMLVKRAIGDLSGSLKIINNDDVNIHSLIAQILVALKAEDMTPDDIMLLSNKASGVIQLKLHDVALIYSKIIEYNSNKIWDKTDAEEYVRGIIPECEFVKNADIYIYGFDILPLSRIRTACALIKARCNITVALQADDTSEIFNRQKRMIASLEEAADAIGERTEKIIISDKNDKKNDIAHLEKNLYSFPNSEYEYNTENISLIEAENRQNEVYYIAERIISAYKEGISLSEIGILSGNPQNYMRYISDVFPRCNIPFFFDGKRSLSSHKLSAFVSELLFLVISDRWYIDDALKYIKTGYVNITEQECGNFVRFVSEHGLRGDMLKKPLKTDSAELENIRERAYADVLALKESTKNDDASELALHLCEFLDNSDIKEKLEKDIEMLEELGLQNERKFIEQIYDKITDNLKQAGMLLKGMEREKLYDVIKTGFENTDISIVPPMSDEVSIGEITHSIFPKKKLMIIMGANDGNLPLKQEGGIFSEYEVDKINENSETIFPGHISIDDQRLFILRAFTSSEKLIITYNDEDGKPALVINRMEKLFPKLNKTEGKTPLTLMGGLDTLCDELRNSLDGEKTQLNMISEYLSDEDGRKQISRLINTLENDGSAVCLENNSSLRLYGNRKISISSIESFNKCPYKHFIQYGLRPAETNYFEESPMDSGIYVHSLLNSVSTAASEKGITNISDDELLSITDNIADEEIKTHNKGIFYNSKRYSVVEKYLRKETKEAVLEIKRQLQNSEMLGTEMEFGGNGFAIPTKYGDIKISGKIDRVDVINKDGIQYAGVIDYKTGTHNYKPKALYDGTDIQLAVYLLAIIQLGKYKPGCAYFMNVNLDYEEEGKEKKEKLSGFSLEGLLPERKDDISEEKLDLILETARNILGETALKIFAGENKIAPINKDACSYCEYSAICRYDGNCGDEPDEE